MDLHDVICPKTDPHPKHTHTAQPLNLEGEEPEREFLRGTVLGVEGTQV